MPVQTKPLVRVFVFNGAKLPDPGSTMTIEQVRTAYAATYPEIATAEIDGPQAVAGTLRYTFNRAVGTKG